MKLMNTDMLINQYKAQVISNIRHIHSVTHVKTHKLSQTCKKVVTISLSSSRQLSACNPSCCENTGTTCYHKIDDGRRLATHFCKKSNIICR